MDHLLKMRAKTSQLLLDQMSTPIWHDLHHLAVVHKVPMKVLKYLLTPFMVQQILHPLVVHLVINKVHVAQPRGVHHQLNLMSS